MPAPANADYKVVHTDSGEHYLFYTPNHRLFQVPAELAYKLENSVTPLTESEESEWRALQMMGALEEHNAELLSGRGRVEEQNLAINLNLTGDCNLDCSYCFASGGDYGRIANKMSVDMIPDIFRFIVKNHTRTKTVRFEFFGGEPLLNVPFIEAILSKSKDLSQQYGLQFISRISTNLTVLPRGVLELFEKHKFIISVSIDGGEATQDRNRPMKSGRGSYAKIIENCRRIREQCRDITLVARMTVAHGSTSLVRDVQELWDLNLFDYFQIYPSLEVPGQRRNDEGEVLVSLPSGSSQPAGIYIDQLKQLLSIYPRLFQRDNRFKGVLECQYIAQMIVQGKAAIRRCGAGDTYYTISPDGSISPCHRLVGEQQFDVTEDRKGIHGDESEWLFTVDENARCDHCWGRYVCGGNCRQENYLATGRINEPNLEGCAYQLAMLEEIIKITPQLAANENVIDPMLDHLFVSCGQPVLDNGRQRIGEHRLRHFLPLY